jgi:hypothetical protein
VDFMQKMRDAMLKQFEEMRNATGEKESKF